MTNNIIPYLLMHKDKEVGVLGIDRYDSRVIAWKPLNIQESPFDGHADLQKLKTWWSTRAIRCPGPTIPAD